MNAEIILDEPAVGMNITSEKAAMFGYVLISVGAVNGAIIILMLMYVYFTTAENMKICEKLIIYNVLLPDLVLEILVARIFGKETMNGEWSYNKLISRWLGFLHAGCVFHANLAVAFICYIIALSMRDICTPWFNVRYQFGSIFMVIAMFGIIVPLELTSTLQLIQSKKRMSQEAKVSQQALIEINKVILFTVVSALMTLLTLPMAVGMDIVDVMLALRVIVYASPTARVLAFLYLCPHFHFGRSSITQEDIEEFMKLGEGETELQPETLEIILEKETLHDTGPIKAT